MLHHIVKRKGHKEYFDVRKIYASVFAACMTLRMHDSEAELIADMVSHEVGLQISEKEVVSAHYLHELTLAALQKYHPDAAYMYEHHKDIE